MNLNKIVSLVQSGKSTHDVSREYNIAKSTVCKWVMDFSSSGFFKAKNNRSDEENELIRKKNQQLKMKNDILTACGADNGTKIAVILANKHK